MAKHSQKEAAITKKRILSSALQLFAEKGYDKTSFDHIAARLKMTKGAVYWHFPSKKDLLAKICEELQQNLTSKFFKDIPIEKLRWEDIKAMLVSTAYEITKDPKRARYFKILYTQIKWGDTSMAKIREQLISSNSTGGIAYTIKLALQNEIDAGRVKKDTDLDVIIAIIMSIRHGLLNFQLDNFLKSDFLSTLETAISAVWDSISTKKGAKTK